MIKQLLFTTALLFGGTVLRADVFSFSYSGGGVNASGTLTATQGMLGYTVTGISGLRNMIAFDASPLGGGFFTYSGTSNASGMIMFSVGVWGIPDIVTFSASHNFSDALGGNGNNFYIGSVPEPTTLSLLLTMGLGVWVLARKLPAKRRS